MADLVVLQLIPGLMTENLDRSLAQPGPHPWALAKYKRILRGVRAEAHVAFMHMTRADGGAVGRQSAYPADAMCHRLVLGHIVRSLGETPTPFFDGFPYEFWFDLIEDLDLSEPAGLSRISRLLNERIPGLGIDEEKFLTVLSNGRSTSIGMFFDGEPRLTEYFAEAAEPERAVAQAPERTRRTGPLQRASTSDSLLSVADEFDEAVKESGLVFAGLNEDLPRSFLAAVMAKRFVLLTGQSGSGKTQIARALGQWFGSDDEGPRHSLIPVRSDWTTPDPLLGFEDALLPPDKGARAWTAPPALQFMLRAVANPGTPFLLVLDEMNLAHVERYFADVLSGMESGEPVLPNLERRTNGYWYPRAEEPSVVPLPDNLLIVGTVNIDETTYQFSPKVLDRSFSFEFRVTTEELSGSLRSLRQVPAGSLESLRAVLDVVTDRDWHLGRAATGLDEIGDFLTLVHNKLSEIGLEFGHRSHREALRLAAILPECGVPEDSIIDIVVMTKILPRVHGSRRQLEPFLRWLQSESAGSDPQKPDMPLVARKVERMLRTLLANQYAGFAE